MWAVLRASGPPSFLFGPLYYSQSCKIHYPVRWRISHYITLNNICKVVSSQRVSLNAGQESFPQHGLLPFRRQSCSTVAAGRAPFASVTIARYWQWFSVGRGYECGCLGARKFCCATCMLDFLTPFLRQGDVTYSFLPYLHSALAVNGSGRMYYLLQLG